MNETQQLPAPTETLIAEPTTAPRVIGTPFPKGVSGNPNGRPKKGQTYQARLEKEVERRSAKAARLHAERFATSDNVRWFAAVYDRLYGPPERKISVTSDAPWLSVIGEALGGGASLEALAHIEGEVRELGDGE